MREEKQDKICNCILVRDRDGLLKIEYILSYKEQQKNWEQFRKRLIDFENEFTNDFKITNKKIITSLSPSLEKINISYNSFVHSIPLIPNARTPSEEIYFIGLFSYAIGKELQFSNDFFKLDTLKNEEDILKKLQDRANNNFNLQKIKSEEEKTLYNVTFSILIETKMNFDSYKEGIYNDLCGELEKKLEEYKTNHKSWFGIASERKQNILTIKNFISTQRKTYNFNLDALIGCILTERNKAIEHHKKNKMNLSIFGTQCTFSAAINDLLITYLPNLFVFNEETEPHYIKSYNESLNTMKNIR